MPAKLSQERIPSATIDFPTRPVDCTQAIKRCLIGAGSDGFLLKIDSSGFSSWVVWVLDLELFLFWRQHPSLGAVGAVARVQPIPRGACRGSLFWRASFCSSPAARIWRITFSATDSLFGI